MPLCSITISLEVWLHCLFVYLFVEWVEWFAWAARGFLSCIDDIAYIDAHIDDIEYNISVVIQSASDTVALE